MAINMEETKGALQSKTVWGAVLALAATGAKMAGFDIGDPSMYVNDILTVIGGAVALYGRIVATKKIG